MFELRHLIGFFFLQDEADIGFIESIVYYSIEKEFIHNVGRIFDRTMRPSGPLQIRLN